MANESFSAEGFFTEIATDAEDRTLLWRSRFQGKELLWVNALFISCKVRGGYLLKSSSGIRV